MAIRNPTAEPGVILASGRNMESFSKYLETVGSIVESEKERKALQQKKLDESLLPLEFDPNSLLPKDVETITNAMGSYERMQADYIGQGINSQDPRSGEAYNIRKKKEGEILTDITYSNQHKKLLQSATDVLSDPNKRKGVNVNETMTRMALIAEEPDIRKREKMIKEDFGGSIVAMKAFNPYEYESEVLKKYKTGPIGDITKAENAPKGFDVLKQQTGYTDSQLGTIAAELLSEEQYKATKQAEFDQLSPAKKAEYSEKVASGNFDSPVEAYVAEEINYRTKGEKASAYKQSKGKVTNINIGDDKEPTIIDPMIYRIGAMVTGDPQYAQKINVPGVGEVKMIEFPTVKIGTYTEKKLKYDADGNPVMKLDAGGKPTSEQDYEIVTKDEIIESVYEVGGKWKISTNKSKYYKQGSRAPGAMDYAVDITSPWDLYQYIAEFTGERNIKEGIKQLKKKGAWDEAKAEPIWNKLYDNGSTDYESELGY